MIEIFGKFTGVAKNVEVYELPVFLNLSDDAEYDGINTTMYVEYTLQPFVYVWGVRSIECCIKNVTIRIEFTIDLDTLSDEEANNLLKNNCWIEKGFIFGVINLDTKNNSEWKIINEIAFEPDGSFSIKDCVIDFKLKQINIS